MLDLLFWELSQQRSVGKATRRGGLVTQALWEIIAETNHLDEKLLIKKVNEVDLRDGKLDGKLKRVVKKCASCGRTLHRQHSKCLYCGSENLQTDPFGT